jgi:hypothetical protein
LSLREHLGLFILACFKTELDSKTYRPVLPSSASFDGGIADLGAGIIYPVEQTYVYEKKWDGNAIAGIKNGLKIKNKGSQYSKGNWLLIFCNADGEFKPEIIKREIMCSDFEWVILVGPSGKGEFDYYIYLVKDWNNYREEIFNLHIDEKGDYKLL